MSCIDHKFKVQLAGLFFTSSRTMTGTDGKEYKWKIDLGKLRVTCVPCVLPMCASDNP
jgi:hypothetical protein